MILLRPGPGSDTVTAGLGSSATATAMVQPGMVIRSCAEANRLVGSLSQHLCEDVGAGEGSAFLGHDGTAMTLNSVSISVVRSSALKSGRSRPAKMPGRQPSSARIPRRQPTTTDYNRTPSEPFAFTATPHDVEPYVTKTRLSRLPCTQDVEIAMVVFKPQHLEPVPLESDKRRRGRNLFWRDRCQRRR
jgi:hypothetical protein